MNDILNQFPLWFFICVIVFGAWCLFVYMLPGVWLWPLNHFFKLTAPLEDYNETSWRDDALCDTPRAFQRSRPVNSSVTRTRSSSGWTRVEARRLPE